MSILGLVVLSAGWASASHKAGSLKNLQHRLASQHLLQAMIRTALGNEAHMVPILADDTYEWRHPRPPAGDHLYWMSVQVVCVCVLCSGAQSESNCEDGLGIWLVFGWGGVGAVGGSTFFEGGHKCSLLCALLQTQADFVDLRPLATFCSEGLAEGVAMWHFPLSGLPETLTFSALLCLLVTLDPLKSLFAQLVTWLASRWETVVTGGFSSPAGTGAVTVGEAKGDMQSTHRMHLMVSKHMNSMQSYCRDAGVISLMSVCTDKSVVGGLPLHNTFVQINGQGEVMFAPSQVEHGGNGGLSPIWVRFPGCVDRRVFVPLR